jgi:hypothetical protein
MVLPFTLKSIILLEKRRIMEIQLFHLQKYNLWKKKIPPKETKKAFKIS